jgi:hypothetical protein
MMRMLLLFLVLAFLWPAGQLHGQAKNAPKAKVTQKKPAGKKAAKADSVRAKALREAALKAAARAKQKGINIPDAGLTVEKALSKMKVDTNLNLNPGTPAKPVTPPVAVPAPVRSASGLPRVTFELLATYDMKARSAPEALQKLDQKEVEIVGFMMPIHDAAELKEFALLPAPISCCFGVPPDENQVVVVELKNTIEPIYDTPIVVRGKFRVGAYKETGYIISLFRISNASVSEF